MVSALASAGAAPYEVGKRDKLSVHVHGEEELSREFVVMQNCAVELALIGSVTVCGRTTEDISYEIRDRLAEGYLVHPKVSVEVSEFGSQQVQVMGEVNKPMNVILDGPKTLVEVILEAGDRNGANVMEAEIVREGVPIATYDLETLPSSAPVFVQGGDIVVLKQARYVYVTGGVEDDGEIVFRPGLSVTEALTKAGGLNNYGHPRRAYIVRADGTREKVDIIRILKGRTSDMTLSPGDKLVIPETAVGSQ